MESSILALWPVVYGMGGVIFLLIAWGFRQEYSNKNNKTEIDELKKDLIEVKLTHDDRVDKIMTTMQNIMMSIVRIETTLNIKKQNKE